MSIRCQRPAARFQSNGEPQLMCRNLPLLAWSPQCPHSRQPPEPGRYANPASGQPSRDGDCVGAVWSRFDGFDKSGRDAEAAHSRGSIRVCVDGARSPVGAEDRFNERTSREIVPPEAGQDCENLSKASCSESATLASTGDAQQSCEPVQGRARRRQSDPRRSACDPYNCAAICRRYDSRLQLPRALARHTPSTSGRSKLSRKPLTT
jgi:hypothetical protein